MREKGDGHPITPDEVISAETLDYLVEGVRVRFVPITPAEAKAFAAKGMVGWYTKDVGNAKAPVKEIHYNPATLSEDPKIVRAFSIHEALHHAKPVARLDASIRRMADRAVPPGAFAATERLRELFRVAVHAYLGNGITDRFLEALAIRGHYRAQFLPDYQAAYAEGKEGRDLRGLPLAMQFIQRLVGSERFFGGSSRDAVDPRVEAALGKLGVALKAVDDVSSYESPLRNETDEEKDFRRKAHAVENLIIPQYVALLDAEAEERRQKMEEATGKKGGDIPQELLDQLGELLQRMISDGRVQFAPPSDQDPLQELLNGALKLPNLVPRGTEGRGKGTLRAQGDEENKEESDIEKMRREARELEEQLDKAKARGTGERLGVSAEAVRAYDGYREKYRSEIERLRDAIIEAMREERQSRLGFTEPHGFMVTPGLESPAITAYSTGDRDPGVHMNIQRGQNFSRVRLLFVVDTSGSMGGGPIEASRAALVVINEAFAEAKNQLASENLLGESEEPLEFGVMAFEGRATVSHAMGAPLDERAKYKIMESLRAGGGTNDYEALEVAEKYVAEQAERSDEPYIDILIVLSDAYGDDAKVSEFSNRVRATQKFSLGAFGLGGNTQAAKVYGGRPGGADAVFGGDYSDPTKALPEIGKFLAGRIEREIEKRKG